LAPTHYLLIPLLSLPLTEWGKMIAETELGDDWGSQSYTQIPNLHPPPSRRHI
jgi:hypothetical protein